jgi:hypothetical protein
MRRSESTTQTLGKASILLLAAVWTLSTLLTSCVDSPPEPGVVTGQVVIRPISPAEEEGEPTPTPWPDLYEGREILIYGPDGEEVIRRAEIDHEGSYREELPPGTYVVDIKRVGPVNAAGLPKTIELASGETVRIDVVIDSGIR